MKGQNLRLGIKSGTSPATTRYIAAALSFDLDVQVDTEESSNKDITGGYKTYEAGLIGWSGSGQANYVNDTNDKTAMQADDMFLQVGKKVSVTFDITEGEKNRSAQTSGKYTGEAIITGWKVSAQNGSNVNYDFTFQGTGPLAVNTGDE